MNEMPSGDTGMTPELQRAIRAADGAELFALQAHTRIDALERNLARWKTISGAALVVVPLATILATLLHGGIA